MRKLHRAMLLTIVLLVLACFSQGAETLPQQLSDQAFWKLVEDSSEPTQVFPGENLMSNELKYPAAVRADLEGVKNGTINTLSDLYPR